MTSYRRVISSYLSLRKSSTALLSRNIKTSSIHTMQNIDPQQEKLLDECCILVNEKDENIGKASKRECHLLGADGSPPPLHRAFSVFLFNSNSELLLQQRSQYKITFPDYFTNTCCSHPLATKEETNEENAQGIKLAAHRRLTDELGIPGHEIHLSDFKYLTRILYASPSMDSEWGEHEVDYILIVKKDVTLNINGNEIQKVVYVKQEDFPQYLKSLEDRNIPITPWFRLISEKFLPLWWKNLDKLDIFVDHDTIHHMK